VQRSGDWQTILLLGTLHLRKYFWIKLPRLVSHFLHTQPTSSVNTFLLTVCVTLIQEDMMTSTRCNNKHWRTWCAEHRTLLQGFQKWCTNWIC